MRMIIATKNQGKFREIKRLFRDVDMEILSLDDIKDNFRIKEDGETFLDNAFKKAAAVSRQFPEDLVVGEDSGLEVDSLDNRPGVYSKRYSGRNATDQKNNQKILDELSGVSGAGRKARFVCALAVVKNNRLVKKIEGKLIGLINESPVGSNGFGYDPIFYLPEYRKTTAQLTMDEKNRISHRAKAFTSLKKYLVISMKNK